MHERVLFWRDLSVPHFRPPAVVQVLTENDKSYIHQRRTLSREPSRSRLERSPRQRATPEGVVAPKEGCPTARRFLHPQVRAVQSLWQTV